MESSTDNHETLSLSLSEMKGILMTMVPDLRRRGHQSDEMLPVMTYMVMPRTGPTVRQASVAEHSKRSSQVPCLPQDYAHMQYFL